MGAVKTMREKMASEGLTSFIVSYDYLAPGEKQDLLETFQMQFWAEDAAHAGEQFDDAEPDARVVLVETQDEYERRTGEKLCYGYTENA
jgi:hypothetical protein